MGVGVSGGVGGGVNEVYTGCGRRRGWGVKEGVSGGVSGGGVSGGVGGDLSGGVAWDGVASAPQAYVVYAASLVLPRSRARVCVLPHLKKRQRRRGTSRVVHKASLVRAHLVESKRV